jgi:hypothetical protein
MCRLRKAQSWMKSQTGRGQIAQIGRQTARGKVFSDRRSACGQTFTPYPIGGIDRILPLFSRMRCALISDSLCSDPTALNLGGVNLEIPFTNQPSQRRFEIAAFDQFN